MKKVEEFKETIGIENVIEAIQSGDMEGILKGLNEGVGINDCDKEGMSLLRCACECNASNEIIELLIMRGAQIDQKIQEGFREGWTLLHDAAHQGNWDVVGILIQHKADINSRTNDMYTPLMLAAGNLHQHIAAKLIDEKADVTLRDNNGKNALDLIGKIRIEDGPSSNWGTGGHMSGLFEMQAARENLTSTLSSAIEEAERKAKNGIEHLPSAPGGPR